MLELSTAGAGGGAGAACSGGGGGGDGAFKKSQPAAAVPVPTVIIDAVPAAASSNNANDEDNGNKPHPVPPATATTGSSHNNSLNNNDSSQSEGMLEEGRVVTVRDLLKGLYEKACQQKLWGLVRHTAGMLGKRVEDLGKAVTDLLVRQKQVTVGMPPNNEHTITAPLPEVELRQLIHDVSTKKERETVEMIFLIIINYTFFRPMVTTRVRPC